MPEECYIVRIYRRAPQCVGAVEVVASGQTKQFSTKAQLMRILGGEPLTKASARKTSAARKPGR